MGEKHSYQYQQGWKQKGSIFPDLLRAIPEFGAWSGA
jgi:hypothetical protein